MLKANQAKEIVKAKREKEIENRKTRAKEFCEMVISKEIERVANLQGNRITITNIEYDIVYLVNDILKENGYKTIVAGASIIEIMWGE